MGETVAINSVCVYRAQSRGRCYIYALFRVDKTSSLCKILAKDEKAFWVW